MTANRKALVMWMLQRERSGLVCRGGVYLSLPITITKEN